MKHPRSMQAQARHIIEVSVAHLALAGAAAVSPPLHAQTAPAAPATSMEAQLKSSFARADTNTDGKLSKEEAKRLPEVSARFEELDTDKDGSLSYAEFAAGVSKG
ncbi:EF-hand domain-containing protein [Rivibacter subsaxonicus]|uniref:EF hand domain-containing protein n=1 Tax=Rivibacter subsaxonicus TaxID=457575 RepID=A0A4Q7VX09_9BURK|nr:EF-hand domain-containing protein [Rivibacter subsaxonicus]RZU00839.1 EF hand domain-containing protein [Rivibacter subsaxonicus]